MAYKLEKAVISGKQGFYQNKQSKKEAPQTCEKDNEVEEGKQEEEEDEPQNSAKDYINVIKKVKKENITPDNISEIMLCQIPGVSAVTAIAIMEKFNTLSNLIKELEINPECLKNISYTSTKGQSRKINKTCIVNIAKFLLKK